MILGFIGCGNMSKAMIGGIINSRKFNSEDIIASDISEVMLQNIKDDFNISTTSDNIEVAIKSDVIFLAIKPQFYKVIIKEISPKIKENAIIVTIAPGQTLDNLEKDFGKAVKVVRTMPNTPALVCEGMTAVCKNELVTESELIYICSILNCFGKSKVVPEYFMNAVVAVSGSAPAYVFMFIEALADGAVREGMPRDMAYEFASQTVLGSAKMVLETKNHPAVLKDMVCSPAGTTIEALSALEQYGFRNSIIKAMEACVNRAKNIK